MHVKSNKIFGKNIHFYKFSHNIVLLSFMQYWQKTGYVEIGVGELSVTKKEPGWTGQLKLSLIFSIEKYELTKETIQNSRKNWLFKNNSFWLWIESKFHNACFQGDVK